MPVSPRNQKVLASLQPEFREAVYAWLNDCAAEELPVLVTEGLRSYERSDALFAQGRTRPGKIVTRAAGGFSYHNFGLAVDVVLANARGNPTWIFDPKGPVWRRVVGLAKARGLAWGGEWRSFPDIPHFQPRTVPSLAECRRRWPGGWIPRA